MYPQTCPEGRRLFADVLAQVGLYSRPSVGLVLGQRRRKLTSIEPAMVCDADPTLHRNWVGRLTWCVRGTGYMVETRTPTYQCHYVTVLSGVKKTNGDSLASIDWILASAGDGGGRNTQ